MDLLSFAVVFVILAASGGIAWIADGLGKKIGKKRISIRFRGWSMRPKHVASLGTVLMGVAVSALTIGFIAAVSRDAREWLKQGRGLLVQRDALRSSVDDLSRSVDLQKTQLGGLNRTIQDDGKRIEEARNELRHKRDEADELDRKVKSLDLELTNKNASLREAKVELDERQRSIDHLERQLPRLARQVATAQGQVRAANDTLAKVNDRLRLVQSNLKRSELALRTAQINQRVAVKNANEALTASLQTNLENQRLTEETQNRRIEVDKLKAEAADLIAQRDVAEAQSNEASACYAAIQNDLKKADQELAETQSALQSVLNSGFKTSRTEAMTYRRGEEVARIVVPAESNVETTRNILASLLRTARIDATDRGAKGHRGFEAADIVDRKDPQTGEVADADTLKRSLVANLAGRTDDQVLVATSSLNAFEGEPVSLDLVAVPNPVVYRRNDTIAETRIDGSQSEDRILAQLSDFMNGELRQRAQRNRMVPRAGTAAPYGEPSAANVWSALQSVRRAGRPVRVSAVAEDDIRAADPLRLGFRVH